MSIQSIEGVGTQANTQGSMKVSVKNTLRISDMQKQITSYLNPKENLEFFRLISNFSHSIHEGVNNCHYPEFFKRAVKTECTVAASFFQSNFSAGELSIEEKRRILFEIEFKDTTFRERVLEESTIEELLLIRLCGPTSIENPEQVDSVKHRYPLLFSDRHFNQFLEILENRELSKEWAILSLNIFGRQCFPNGSLRIKAEAYGEKMQGIVRVLQARGDHLVVLLRQGNEPIPLSPTQLLGSLSDRSKEETIKNRILRELFRADDGYHLVDLAFEARDIGLMQKLFDADPTSVKRLFKLFKRISTNEWPELKSALATRFSSLPKETFAKLLLEEKSSRERGAFDSLIAEFAPAEIAESIFVQKFSDEDGSFYQARVQAISARTDLPKEVIAYAIYELVCSTFRVSGNFRPGILQIFHAHPELFNREQQKKLFTLQQDGLTGDFRESVQVLLGECLGWKGPFDEYNFLLWAVENKKGALAQKVGESVSFNACFDRTMKEDKGLVYLAFLGGSSGGVLKELIQNGKVDALQMFFTDESYRDVINKNYDYLLRTLYFAESNGYSDLSAAVRKIPVVGNNLEEDLQFVFAAKEGSIEKMQEGFKGYTDWNIVSLDSRMLVARFDLAYEAALESRQLDSVLELFAKAPSAIPLRMVWEAAIKMDRVQDLPEDIQKGLDPSQLRGFLGESAISGTPRSLRVFIDNYSERLKEMDENSWLPSIYNALAKGDKEMVQLLKSHVPEKAYFFADCCFHCGKCTAKEIEEFLQDKGELSDLVWQNSIMEIKSNERLSDPEKIRILRGLFGSLKERKNLREVIYWAIKQNQIDLQEDLLKRASMRMTFCNFLERKSKEERPPQRCLFSLTEMFLRGIL